MAPFCCSPRTPGPTSPAPKSWWMAATCAARCSAEAVSLERNAANYVPLTPVSFLKRSAHVFGDRTAVIHGERRYSYRELMERCVRLASALSRLGVRQGDTVAVLAPNVPAMLEAHYGVP